MPFYNTNTIALKNLATGVEGKYIHGDSMSFGEVYLKAGCGVPLHQHIFEQITYVASGEVNFTIDGETKLLTKGMAAVIPSNIWHGATAVSDCVLIDVFSPVREEYK